MTALPDKWVRKAIYDAIHNMTVNLTVFPCYTEQTGIDTPKTYTLISTQLNQPESTKCGVGWFHSVEVQVIVRRRKNEGSKLLIDDASNMVISALRVLTLDAGSSMSINERNVSVDNEFSEEGATYITYRKVIRMQAGIT